MAEITAAGYTQLRTGSPVDEWFVEFRDDQGDPVPIDDGNEGQVTRLSAADDRVTVTDNPGTSTVTFEVVLTGADVSPGVVELPVTIASSVLFAADSGGTALTEVEALEAGGSPAPFTFADASDQATFRHHVEAPEQSE